MKSAIAFFFDLFVVESTILGTKTKFLSNARTALMLLYYWLLITYKSGTRVSEGKRLAFSERKLFYLRIRTSIEVLMN